MKEIPKLDQLLAMRRWCYTIVPTQDPKVHGGYVPSLVVEGDPGHRPMIGGGGRAPWVWGKTLEDAEKVCAAYNLEHLGIDDREAFKIVCSTMRPIGSEVAA